jgi:hypothetical protein
MIPSLLFRRPSLVEVHFRLIGKGIELRLTVRSSPPAKLSAHFLAVVLYALDNQDTMRYYNFRLCLGFVM